MIQEEKEISFEKEVWSVLNWNRDKTQPRPRTLDYVTNRAEVAQGLKFLDQIKGLQQKGFVNIFSKDYLHYWSKWVQEAGNVIFFLNRLDIENFARVAKYLQPKTDFWILYRAHAFFQIF